MSEFEGYGREVILIKRLLEFSPTTELQWDNSGIITMPDISDAIGKLPEIFEPYVDIWRYPVKCEKSRNWHIGRIIYFIKHPEEIKDIEIDNECFEGLILAQPLIIDGWHRWAAAVWLYNKNEMEHIGCKYGGRMDVLEYLKGETDELNYDAV